MDVKNQYTTPISIRIYRNVMDDDYEDLKKNIKELLNYNDKSYGVNIGGLFSIKETGVQHYKINILSISKEISLSVNKNPNKIYDLLSHHYRMIKPFWRKDSTILVNSKPILDFLCCGDIYDDWE